MDQEKKHPKEGQPILDILWQFYGQNGHRTDVRLTENYRALEKHLVSLSGNARDAAMDAVYAICVERQRLAFLDGIRTGMRLMKELNNVENRSV